MATTTQKITALFMTIRPLTILLALAGTYLGGIIAGAQPTSLPLILAMTAVALTTASSMAYNDYLDRDIDKISHPERPLPNKILKPKTLLYYAILLFAAAALLTIQINLLCLLMLLFTLFVLLSYELLFKNQGLAGNITVAFLSSLSFTFGGAAVSNPTASFIFSLITFFLFVAIEIYKDVHDVKGDTLNRVTLPMKIGEKNAAIIGSASLVVAILITPIPYLYYNFGLGYLSFMILVDIIWTYSIISTLKDITKTGPNIQLIRKAAALALLAILIGAIV